MLFNSYIFVFLFLPFAVIGYYGLHHFGWKRAALGYLIMMSMVFYGYNSMAYLAMLVISILVNFFLVRLMDMKSGQGWRRVVLLLGLAYNLGILFYFKYYDFFIENVNTVFRTDYSFLRLALPLGISFYTFQISSYLFDVYRERISAEHSFLTLGTYLCMFPQLIAGPVVTYSQIRERLRSRAHSFRHVEEGMRTFTVGLAFKVLLANRVGNLWTQVNTIGFESISCPLAWMGIAAYSFQIYFDFYGYSLMAKGLGRMMGFAFPDNFRHPYLSRSMTEFWRRWHMTLGGWFREYVYIPLGGNRSHPYRNLFVVWMLTGLWHGASWNFVLWGFVLFALILLEKCGLGKILDRLPVLGHLYMLFAIPLTWLVFAISDLKQLAVYLGRLAPLTRPADGTVFQGDFLKYGSDYFLPLAASFLCCSGLPEKWYEAGKYTFPATLALVVLFWACVYCMYLGLDDPFLYYQF